jgi:Mrp family chromosome partitioning ATPase
MSVIHDRLNELEAQDNPGQNWYKGLSGSGALGFDLPQEVINDFYDLKEYIRIANLRGKLRTLSFVSASPGEGASTVAAYVAYLMGGGHVTGKAVPPSPEDRPSGFKPNKDKSVFKKEFESAVKDQPKKEQEEQSANADQDTRDILLVDANFHDPRQADLFGVKSDFHLGSILEHGMDWRKVVKPIDGSRLHLIPGGYTEAPPAEWLGSDRFHDLLKEWRKSFSYVLFDSLPVLTTVGALSLSALVDGVVLVVRAGQTRWDMAQQAKRKLVAAHANLLGVALNRYKP